MDSDLSLEFLRVVEQAAIACAHTMGQGDRHASDRVAVEAMRRVMDTVPIGVTAARTWKMRANEVSQIAASERKSSGRAGQSLTHMCDSALFGSALGLAPGCTGAPSAKRNW